MTLVHELSQLLRVWRKQDRIRSAPSLGSLLVFEPERELLIQGAVYRIAKRTLTTDDAAVQVMYTLIELESSAVAQLEVSIVLARPTQGNITFARDSSTMELFLEDVTVLSLGNR